MGKPLLIPEIIPASAFILGEAGDELFFTWVPPFH